MAKSATDWTKWKEGDPLPTLTARQARFVTEYSVDMNGTQAAIRAGYSPKSAFVEASRMLRNPKIMIHLRNARDQWAEANGINQHAVLNELSALGFGNIYNFVTFNDAGQVEIDLSKATPKQLKALNSVTVHTESFNKDGEDREVTKTIIKLHDKRLALQDIGKHLGMFTDVVDHRSGDGSMSPAPTTIRLVGVDPDGYTVDANETDIEPLKEV